MSYNSSQSFDFFIDLLGAISVLGEYHTNDQIICSEYSQDIHIKLLNHQISKVQFTVFILDMHHRGCYDSCSSIRITHSELNIYKLSIH